MIKNTNTEPSGSRSALSLIYPIPLFEADDNFEMNCMMAKAAHNEKHEQKEDVPITIMVGVTITLSSIFLISLINSIVSEEDQVVDLTLLNPYNPKSFKEDKLSVLDIKVKCKDGSMFNIEVQISDEADYDKRALYDWAKLFYMEQLKTAED